MVGWVPPPGALVTAGRWLLLLLANPNLLLFFKKLGVRVENKTLLLDVQLYKRSTLMRKPAGLIVPEPREKIAIRVDKEIYHWREGEAVVFDDAYEHGGVVALLQRATPLGAALAAGSRHQSATCASSWRSLRTSTSTPFTCKCWRCASASRSARPSRAASGTRSSPWATRRAPRA